MLGKRVQPRHYAQLAALLAYLFVEKPQWLPTIGSELASGGTSEQAFRKCGTTFDDVQAAWMKWGAANVIEGPDAGSVLPVPEELREVGTD